VASWKGQSRGNVLGYKIFITVLRFSGLPLAYFIMRFVAFYFFLFIPSSFRNTFSFYRNRLKFGFLPSIVAVYRNYYSFGKVILDKTAAMAGFPTRFSFNFDGEHHLRKMVAGKTGGLLISAHVGNFEMAGHMLNRLETGINIIMLDAEHEKIKKYLVEHRLVPAAQARPALGAVLTPSGDLKEAGHENAGMAPLIKDYRFIRVIVGGGPGAFIVNLVGGGATPGQKEIQKIDLPRNWEKLVAKYKNVVPVYAKY